MSNLKEKENSNFKIKNLIKNQIKFKCIEERFVFICFKNIYLEDQSKYMCFYYKQVNNKISKT